MELKKISLLMIVFFILAIQSEGQLYNNGATIKIQSGASVFVAGDVQNNSAGVISNDGKLEVQGSFTNNATYNSVTLDDSLILSGGGNVTLNGGASTLNYITINKTANTNNVTLTGSTLLGTKLDYISGNFTTDPITNPSFVFSAPVSAIFNFTPGREITGKVTRTSWVNGAAVVFNQPNMLVTTNGGTAPSTFTVLMIPQSGGGDPTLAEREVKRKFQFTQTGGTAFTSDIRFAYLDGELNTNTEANLVPWDLITTEWNGRLTPVTRDIAVNYVSTTGIPFTELSNEWKLADPRYTFNATAFMRGPWNGSTAMNTSLNSGGILPTTQPYNTTPFNYTGTETVGAIPNANVVDWVLVELRKPATGLPQDALSSTIIGRKAGFVLNNGLVVDIDGVTPISFDISKQGSAFMVVRHRNHLGVMSNALGSNAAGTFTNDYSLLANSYKPTGAPSNPVVLLPGVGGKYGMWGGDANKNGVVNVTDINVIKFAISASATGYVFTDANLNNAINATDVSFTKATIASTGTGGTPLKTNNNNATYFIISNLPDPVNVDK
ncbi:MAG: hypothetical protein ABJA37_01615 [Ferruginibacter sp.]